MELKRRRREETEVYNTDAYQLPYTLFKNI